MTAERVALRARLVFPVTSPPIDGGIVTLEGNRIVAVGENTAPTPPRDLGDVALLPGLINTHTHLEFSELHSPLGDAGMPLPDWIARVVTRRHENADVDGAVLSTGRRLQAIQAGIHQCLQAGVTTVGDITTWDISRNAQFDPPLHYYAFRELIGLNADRVQEQLATADAYLADPHSGSVRFVRGLSPHAPYTAAPDLVRQVADMSRQRRLIVAMHLAESLEELQLLEKREGPFRDLLKRFDAWDDKALPGGARPLDYLQMLSESYRSLIIHGNYLESQDWAFMARHRNNMSIVYCPRTHHYFRHAPYPLNDMLRAGVRVTLGTDGRGSNPDLNLLRELQFAAAHHRIGPADLLRMITIDAAHSLGCDKQTGSIEVGKSADLTLVRLRSQLPRAPYESLLSPKARICGVWTDGVEYTASEAPETNQQPPA